MKETILLDTTGYATSPLNAFEEKGTISMQHTVMIMAKHLLNKKGRGAKIYYNDGQRLGVRQTTNQLMKQLEQTTGHTRQQHVRPFQRLLPECYQPQTKSLSWIRGGHAFLPVTCYSDGPTTWLNVQYIEAVEVRGAHTIFVMRDAPNVAVPKRYAGIMKQLTIIKIISHWMCQISARETSWQQSALPEIAWPNNVPVNINHEALFWAQGISVMEQLADRLVMDEPYLVADLLTVMADELGRCKVNE